MLQTILLQMVCLKIHRIDSGGMLTANLETMLDLSNHRTEFVIFCNTNQTQKTRKDLGIH